MVVDVSAQLAKASVRLASSSSVLVILIKTPYPLIHSLARTRILPV
jgi:hypothetical protein